MLDAESIPIGAVENLQDMSWSRVTIGGTASHAGTTPMAMRRDAGLAAAHATTYLDALARGTRGAVATVGTMRLEPNAINVIASSACFSVDMRNPGESLLQQQEAELAKFLGTLRDEGYAIASTKIMADGATRAHHLRVVSRT